MARKRAKEHATEAIIGLARRQHGVFARRQLAQIGVSDDQVLGRAAAGWLTRVHRGVYAVGPGPLSWRGRWMAAVLACGEGAVLSHSSAAALWKIAPPREGDVEVTVHGGNGRSRRRGIRVHRSVALTSEECAERDGIPVTSVARTVGDLASAGASVRTLERLLDAAEHRGLLDLSAFDAGVRPGGDRAAARCAGVVRAGSRPLPRRLREVLASHEPGATATRSELEERFLALCRDRGLPQPLVNAPLLGLTVDFVWPRAALVVEVDGRATHDTGRAFHDDRDRDSMLTAAGFRVMRFTWRDVTLRPGVVAQRLRRALGV